MSRHPPFILVNPTVRANAVRAVEQAPDGWQVVVKPSTRSLDQNAYLHKLFTELAAKKEWYGKRFTMLTWKRLCMASWLREKGEQPELIPALDGHGVDIVFEHTSELTIPECAELIEWTLSFGAQNGVEFSPNPNVPTDWRFNSIPRRE